MVGPSNSGEVWSMCRHRSIAGGLGKQFAGPMEAVSWFTSAKPAARTRCAVGCGRSQLKTSGRLVVSREKRGGGRPPREGAANRKNASQKAPAPGRIFLMGVNAASPAPPRPPSTSSPGRKEKKEEEKEERKKETQFLGRDGQRIPDRTPSTRTCWRSDCPYECRPRPPTVNGSIGGAVKTTTK